LKNPLLKSMGFFHAPFSRHSIAIAGGHLLKHAVHIAKAVQTDLCGLYDFRLRLTFTNLCLT